ncbi:unnamed protein product [marine sediment metagenome]|uniref:Uncharacterized protein n=1 Tax=marine sediment metagenome TaxID=412755 RepID=X1LUH0_9ZZZZ
MSLSDEALDYLEEEFTKRWPQAAQYLRTTTPGTKLYEAVALIWMGFKEGYLLAAPEAMIK